MTHSRRRWLLYRAVAHLEPSATPGAIVLHVGEQHDLDISLLRLHVDMAKLVGYGVLAVRSGGQSGTTWQTTARELAQPRQRPRAGSAGETEVEGELNGELG